VDWVRSAIPPRLHDERSGIESLSPRQREVLELRCRQEMTMPEAAEAMGITHHTIKGHMTVLLRKLGRRSCQGACFDLGEYGQRPVHAMRPEAV
jgi:DNA-binding CsgD family transcriptional regulator